MRAASSLGQAIIPGIWRFALLACVCLGGLYLTDAVIGKSSELASLQVAPGFIAFLLPAQTVLLAWTLFCWKSIAMQAFGLKFAWDDALYHVGLTAVAKYIPGKIWGVVGKTLIAGQTGLSKALMVQAAIYEQLLTLAVGAWFGLALYIIVDEPRGGAALAITGLLLVPFLFHVMLRYLPGVAARWPFIRRRLDADLVIPVPSRSALLRSVALYLSLWLLTGLVVSSLLTVTGVTLDLPMIIRTTGATMLAVCGGFLALFSPGGLVVREGLLVALLGPFLGPVIALQFALVMRIWNLAFDVFCVALAGGAFLLLNRNQAAVP